LNFALNVSLGRGNVALDTGEMVAGADRQVSERRGDTEATPHLGDFCLDALEPTINGSEDGNQRLVQLMFD